MSPRLNLAARRRVEGSHPIRTQRKLLKRRLAAAGGVAAIAVTGAVAVAPQAEAYGVSYIMGPYGGANLRNQCGYPSTSCPNNPYLGWIPNGWNVQMVCWRWGQTATGNYSSAKWFWVQVSGPNGPAGWVHSSLVYNQTAVPAC